MKTVFYHGRVLCEGGEFSENCPVLCEDGRIVAIGGDADVADAEERIDLCGLTLLPGLVDVHTHGRAGYDFCDATEDEMRLMKKEYARRGVTSVFATLASATKEEWLTAISRIEACGFAGIHLEGRYLNAHKRGAHAAELLCAPDAKDVDEVLSHIHLPCHISAAFELDTDGSFAAVARAHGATLGIGHTSATAEETRTAISRGVTSFTHLFNAMPPLHHREGGPVAVALTGGGYGELIADGIHVCPDVINLAYRSLGRDKTVLITDSMSGTGCPDGNYSIAGMPVILKDGKALTTEGALAGSTLNLWDAVQNLMKFTGCTLADAVRCATVNPARMVGIDDQVGSIAPGKRADLIAVDAQNKLCRIWQEGREVQ